MLKVGDRVRLKQDPFDTKPESGPTKGMVGKIVSGEDYEQLVLVRFDKEFSGGHEGDGTVPYGHGWWCDRDVLTKQRAPKSGKPAARKTRKPKRAGRKYGSRSTRA